MKHIKLFEQFINEGKYDNTFYENIRDAKFRDANLKKYRAGKSMNMRGPGPTRPDQMEAYITRRNFDVKDTVPFQREELQNNISPDTDWSKVPDKDIKKYMNDLKKSIMYEVNNDRIITKIEAALNKIQIAGNLQISAHAIVPEHFKMKFALPAFTTQDDLKSALKFIDDSEEIEINAQPKVVNKWQVEYSGTITNDKGDTLEFKNVNNGLAVNIN